MKITKREKVLLLFLSVLILIVGYYQFILTPQLHKISDLKIEAKEYKNKVQKAKIAISPKNRVHKDYKILNSKILFACQNLFPMIIQEKYITILDKMGEKNGIKFSSISFTEEEVGTIEGANFEDGNFDYELKQLVQEYNNEAKNIDDDKKSAENKEDDRSNSSEESSEELEKMEVNISFEGNYGNVIKFIKNIESFNKKILISSLNLSSTEEGSILGNIILDFYAVPKFKKYDDDIDYLKWDIQNKYGKVNPFDPFSGYINENIINSDRESKEKYDFIMSVRPITSDLPTIIIGKTKDAAMKSYAYGDNESFENVEFEILQEGNKYFYKYKTESDSYPKEYENNKIEFKPNGKFIKLNIISNKRNSKKDNSGMNLTLNNKSNLQVVVKIDYDDTKKSRVNIMKKIGNIIVKR